MIMDTAIRKHLYKETMISAIINSAFSFGITFLILGGAEVIEKQELVIDALPQSFFVTFFGVFIPTFLTRKKITSGHLATLPYEKSLLPNNAFFRAVLMGVIVAIAGGLLHLIVLTGLGIEQLAINTVFVYKTLYGAALSCVVTPIALLLTLKETGKSL